MKKWRFPHCEFSYEKRKSHPKTTTIVYWPNVKGIWHIELQKELKLTPGEDGAYKKVEHYIRSGLPLPDKFTNEVPITQEELHNAIKNIFASRAKKLQLDKKRIQGYSKINEHILNLIDEFYANIKLCHPYIS